MKQLGLLLFALMFVAGIGPDVELPVTQDIMRFLPASGDLVDFKPVTPPQRYVGENLYQLINGGAALYYEYGFNQVVTQEYKNAEGHSIYLELYEMNNATAAFGMFTFKTDKTGEKIPIGSAAFFEKYYLNFWKGKYLATISAYDIHANNKEALITIAQAVESKITSTGSKPLLVQIFPDEDSLLLNIEYIRGFVGLSSHYNFSTKDVFGVKECVIAEYDTYQVFAFKYGNEHESMSWFTNAKNNLENSDQSEDVIDLFGIFSF